MLPPRRNAGRYDFRASSDPVVASRKQAASYLHGRRSQRPRSSCWRRCRSAFSTVSLLSHAPADSRCVACPAVRASSDGGGGVMTYELPSARIAPPIHRLIAVRGRRSRATSGVRFRRDGGPSAGECLDRCSGRTRQERQDWRRHLERLLERVVEQGSPVCCKSRRSPRITFGERRGRLAYVTRDQSGSDDARGGRQHRPVNGAAAAPRDRRYTDSLACPQPFRSLTQVGRRIGDAGSFSSALALMRIEPPQERSFTLDGGEGWRVSSGLERRDRRADGERQRAVAIS